MRKFLKQFERNCISGLLVLLPLIIFFLIIQKIWFFFQKYGDKLSQVFGLDKVFGTIASDFFGGLILVSAFYFSGYLMRLTYLRKFTNWINDQLMIFLPGYEKNKIMAEEKLKARIKKASTSLPVLVRFEDYWQPAHLIEEADGNAVVFVPIAPNTDQGQIYLVSSDRIKRLNETSLKNLDTSVKLLGKGILKFK